jgi:D-alanine transaminase
VSDVLYVNGRFTTTDERVLGVEDRGFQFGDAVYEVVKFLGKRPIFLAEHHRRMESGLRAISIPSPWDEARFAAVVGELLGRTAFDDGIVYVQVSRGEARRAHFYPDDMTPTVVAYSRSFAFPDAAAKERGIAVVTTPDLRWRQCQIKSVNLLPNAMAKKKAQRAGATEALFISDGVVREGASSSFFGVRGGRAVTHPLDEHILPGVVRDRVVQLAGDVDERPLREDELHELDEAFITSTTMGVMPVVAIDGRAVADGRRGTLTATLQRALDEAERGRDSPG